jgi:glutaconate CoA-transferase, subunit B
MSTAMTTVIPVATARAEIMISAILPMLEGLRHIAVGASSPVPGSAALLTRALSKGKTRVSLLGSRQHNPFTDGGKELFDCAAQGRIDAFFLSGGQIDGSANINLMGLGPHGQPKVRFPGSFGSAYLYHIIPRVVLFREEHTPRTLVTSAEFITAAGTSPAGEFRPGGPFALVTGLCVFSFDRTAGKFTLVSTHPGISAKEVRAATGFDYIEPATVPQTPALTGDVRTLLLGEVAAQIAEIYPAFVKDHWRPLTGQDY